MAFDGVLTRALVRELEQTLDDARITKIAQPESEELLITFKTFSGQKKLLISANASLPLMYLTEENKQSPAQAPNFCMLLRKHIGSGHLISVSQPGLERIVDFTFEHLDELGDLRQKHLIVELMGKHSNIIFTDEHAMILDAIRHVPPSVSSVRTVLPGRDYFIAETQDKKDALTTSPEAFRASLDPLDTLGLSLFKHYTGFSKQTVSELLYESGLSEDRFVSDLSDPEKDRLTAVFTGAVQKITAGDFTAEIAYEGKTPVSFSALPLSSYRADPTHARVVSFETVSEMLETYYRERNIVTNMHQRSADLRKVVQTLLERAVKKHDLQEKQLKDTEKRETQRLYGELLNAYSYSLPVGEKSIKVLNYYTNEEIDIPTDPDLSIADNAKKYFDKYTKQKRTYNALSELIQDTEAEIEHLSSIAVSIDMALSADDLIEIRQEMADAGYIKKNTALKNGRKQKTASRPYHYLSSDGFDIYVGRNNLQNDELTFKFADGNDIWMHAKKTPGSHVIIKTNGAELPDRTYEEGAALAAYYSTARSNAKVEVDYVEKKQVKKPAGARPGFVVYYTNYSMVAEPDISMLREVKAN